MFWQNSSCSGRCKSFRGRWLKCSFLVFCHHQIISLNVDLRRRLRMLLICVFAFFISVFRCVPQGSFESVLNYSILTPFRCQSWFFCRGEGGGEFRLCHDKIYCSTPPPSPPKALWYYHGSPPNGSQFSIVSLATKTMWSQKLPLPLPLPPSRLSGN